MQSPPKTEDVKKSRRIKVPLIIRIAVLLVIAGLLGFTVVEILSRKSRMELAVEEGGNKTLYGCIMASQLLSIVDKDELLLQGPENPVDPNDEEWRNSFNDCLKSFNIHFFTIAFTMKLKYLYYYTVDEQGVRHRIISVSGNIDETDEFSKKAGYGTTNDDPLDDNEIRALAGDMSMPYATYENSYGNVCSSVIPYYDNEGNVAALIGADCDEKEIIKSYEKQETFRNILIVSMFLIMLLISGIILHMAVLKPARNLSKQMRSFAENPDIPLTKREYHFADEVTEMEHSFRVMARNIRDYIGNIETLTRDKAVSDVQMETAKRIQMGMVPPEMDYGGEGFAVSAIMQPALSVGGDFYDAFELPSGKYAIVIGDVSGKGIGAALFMAMTRRIIHEKLMQNKRVAKVLAEANREICMENPEGFFATVIAAIYNPKTGLLTLANAGHNPPLLVDGKRTTDGVSDDALAGNPSALVKELTVDPGMVLGLFDDSEYVEEKIMIPSGYGIFLYTDGATEAVNTKREPYGLDQLITELSMAEHTAKGMVERIRDSVIGFEGEAGFFDDLTLVALIREGSSKDKEEPDDLLKESEVRLEVEATLKELDRIKDEFFWKIEMSDNRKKEIYLVLEEWFADIVSYSGATKVDVEMYTAGDEFTAVFMDNGEPFDLVNYEPEEKEFEDFDLGGMGIGLIKTITKHLFWERVGEYNKVTMVFAMEHE